MKKKVSSATWQYKVWLIRVYAIFRNSKVCYLRLRTHFIWLAKFVLSKLYYLLKEYNENLKEGITHRCVLYLSCTHRAHLSVATLFPLSDHNTRKSRTLIWLRMWKWKWKYGYGLSVVEEVVVEAEEEFSFLRPLAPAVSYQCKSLSPVPQSCATDRHVACVTSCLCHCCGTAKFLTN